MEIERKFLVAAPPSGYEAFPFHQIEQAYLCTGPVVRIRREDQSYYLTYKSSGALSREEYNLPLTSEAYAHLRKKADGNILEKKRYLLPLPGRPDLTIEMDVFEGVFSGLILAEVEFKSEEDALSFTPPEWFGRDVTWSGEYQNHRQFKTRRWSFLSAAAAGHDGRFCGFLFQIQLPPFSRLGRLITSFRPFRLRLPALPETLP